MGENILRIGKNSQISPQAIIEQPENVFIGDNVQIKPGVVLRPETGFISIGNNVVINHYTVIHAKGGVEIGDWTVIAPHCGIYAQNHTYDSFEIPITKQANTGKGITLVGDNWIGAGSIVLDDTTIGKGTVIGAGAVVTKSFSMAKVVAGNPAKIIKNRFHGNQWNFLTEERCSSTGTPEKYWHYIKQRAVKAGRCLNPCDKVLDIGCGDGYVTNILRKKCKQIIGIDYSDEAICEARKLYSIDELFQMNSTNIQFDEASFDKVLCLEVLEHLTVLQAKKTLSEVYRVLKPGGMLVGSTPLRTSPESSPLTYSHIYEYSEAELRQLFKSFEGVMVSEGNFFIARKPV
jgi:acetyltransferase-like isoleucine patch superfamily enzyme